MAAAAFRDALSATAYATTNVEELALFGSDGTLLARFGAAHPSGEAVRVRVRNGSGFDFAGVLDDQENLQLTLEKDG